MTAADSDEYEDRIATRTAEYLDRVEECVRCLPLLVEQYAEGERYRETVERIRDLESDCDRLNRRLQALVATARTEQLEVRLTRLHLNADGVIELYRLLDEIPNAAEQFAEELAAIDPPRSSACLAPLAEMAECVATTTSPMASAVTKHARMLCRPEASTALGEEVGQVRAAEGECDRLRNEVTATAFDGECPAPLVYRELAVILDGVPDAMEDVTDQLLLVAGDPSWFEDIPPEV